MRPTPASDRNVMPLIDVILIKHFKRLEKISKLRIVYFAYGGNLIKKRKERG